MSIDASMLEATWWGVAAAGAAGVGGLVVGVIGITQARAARKLAADANRTAEDAVAVAREANTISVGANDLSAEANAISRQVADRDIEDHDVRWNCDWEGPGQYALRNAGKHTALEVDATVVIDGEERSWTFPRIQPGNRISFSFPEAAAETARRKKAEKKRQSQSSVPADVLRFMPPSFTPPVFASIHEHIRWKTALGKPMEHDKNYPMGPPSP
jgi:hypothetical protein